MSWRRFLASTFLLLTIFSRGAAQDPDPRDEVLAVASALFDAMRAQDTAAVRALFEPGARLIGMRPRPDGTLRMQQLTVDQFVAFVGRDTPAPWIERAFHPEVRVSGSLATVWADYDFHLGDRFSHCGVDALQLLRLPDAGWKIVSLADTYVRDAAACPRRPPPAP